MKKLIMYTTAVLIGLFAFHLADAQHHRGHGNNHRSHAKVVHVSNHHKQPVRVKHTYVRHVSRAPHRYVAVNHGRARYHDAWYYDRHFNNRRGYVYFPRYRTYYDPYRRGYLYWHNSAWVFASAVPSFMVGLDIGGLSLQFTSRLPI